MSSTNLAEQVCFLISSFSIQVVKAVIIVSAIVVAADIKVLSFLEIQVAKR